MESPVVSFGLQHHDYHEFGIDDDTAQAFQSAIGEGWERFRGLWAGERESGTPSNIPNIDRPDPFEKSL